MILKNTGAFTALSFSDKTNIEGLFRYVRVKARELYNDAAQNNLEIIGPVYWIYTGMDGKPETIFNLDIILPVSPVSNYQGRFQLSSIPAFKCLSATHMDTWEKLPETYGALFREIGAKNLGYSGVCREVYIHMDFENPSNNITEVQIGIL